ITRPRRVRRQRATGLGGNTLSAPIAAESGPVAASSHWPCRGCPRQPTGRRIRARPSGNVHNCSPGESTLSLDGKDVSDEQLLDRLRHGDLGAGQTLVERHYMPLMRYLTRLAGSRAADDLHQRTWLSILAHADRFVATGDAGSFRGWLFRIAANKSKDYWRSAAR